MPFELQVLECNLVPPLARNLLPPLLILAAAVLAVRITKARVREI